MIHKFLYAVAVNCYFCKGVNEGNSVYIHSCVSVVLYYGCVHSSGVMYLYLSSGSVNKCPPEGY